MKGNHPVLLSLLLALASPGAHAEDAPAQRFSAGTRIPASLTLYPTHGDPGGRLTPIRNNYRPSINLGGADITCMFYLPPSREQVAPGESAEVSMNCQSGISVPAGGGRFVVKEGQKEVGYGIAGTTPTTR